MSDGIGRKLAWISAGAAAMGGLWLAVRATAPRPVPVTIAPAAPTAAPPEADEPDEDTRSYSFRLPSGEPTMLGCSEARRIVEQVRAGLAYEPEAVAARAASQSSIFLPSSSPMRSDACRSMAAFVGASVDSAQSS